MKKIKIILMICIFNIILSEQMFALCLGDIYKIQNAKIVMQYPKNVCCEDMDTILFGSYPQNDITGLVKEPIEWIVLDKKDGMALLLSKYILDCKCYNSEDLKNTTWENCDLRKWLNNDFYNWAFNDSEKAKIINSCIENKNINSKNIVNSMNNTYDNIFCLSYDEIVKYFYQEIMQQENYRLATSGTNYARNVKCDGEILEIDDEENWNNGNSAFYLRSVQCYMEKYDVVGVGLVNGIGNVGDEKSGVSSNYATGVRPALWISCENIQGVDVNINCNYKFKEFINDERFRDGVEWGENKTADQSIYNQIQGYGCFAYCQEFLNYCYGIYNPYAGEKFNSVSNIRAGDIIHTVKSNNEHWFVVLDRDGDDLYVAEGNWKINKNPVVRIGWNYNINTISDFDCGYHFENVNFNNINFQSTAKEGIETIESSVNVNENFNNKTNINSYVFNNQYNKNIQKNNIDVIIKNDIEKMNLSDVIFQYNNSQETYNLYRKKDNSLIKEKVCIIEVVNYITGQISSATYYFDNAGKMLTGWGQDEKGIWYYFEENKNADYGKMWTGWKMINGKYYFFGSDGKMLSNTYTPDGYYVNSDGTWTK